MCCLYPAASSRPCARSALVQCASFPCAAQGEAGQSPLQPPPPTEPVVAAHLNNSAELDSAVPERCPRALRQPTAVLLSLPSQSAQGQAPAPSTACIPHLRYRLHRIRFALGASWFQAVSPWDPRSDQAPQLPPQHTCRQRGDVMIEAGSAARKVVLRNITHLQPADPAAEAVRSRLVRFSAGQCWLEYVSLRLPCGQPKQWLQHSHQRDQHSQH